MGVFVIRTDSFAIVLFFRKIIVVIIGLLAILTRFLEIHSSLIILRGLWI